MFASPSLALREACFRLYTECISLLEAEPVPSAIQGLSAGLRDESPGVRLAALAAACALLKNAEPASLDQYAALVVPMLDVRPCPSYAARCGPLTNSWSLSPQVLPPLVASKSEARLSTALLALIDLASTPKIPSRIFKPHLSSILALSIAIISPSPFRGSPNYDVNAMDETVRTPALESVLPPFSVPCDSQLTLRSDQTGSSSRSPKRPPR
jgi:hypothetical protein